MIVAPDVTVAQAQAARKALGEIFAAIDDQLGAALAELPGACNARVSIEAARSGVGFLRDQFVDRIMAHAETLARRG